MNNFKITEKDNKIVIEIDGEIITEIVNYDNEKKYQIIDEIKNMFFGEDNLKIDFYDFKCMMKKNSRLAFIGIGHKTGKNSAYEVLKESIDSLSLNGIDIMSSKGLLINTTTNENYPLVKFDESFELLLEKLIENEETYILQSEFCDDSFSDDEIKVTIIASGF